MLSALEVNTELPRSGSGGSRRAVRRGSLALKRRACHDCGLARLPHLTLSQALLRVASFATRLSIQPILTEQLPCSHRLLDSIFFHLLLFVYR